MVMNAALYDLEIRIFDVGVMKAQVVPSLTAHELVEAILLDFTTELPYLTGHAADYEVRIAGAEIGLDMTKPISQLAGKQPSLLLLERTPSLPQGARSIRPGGYLKEPVSNTVYRLGWQPAILGRAGQNMADNPLLAVNLGSYTTGLRVSRRHAQIIEEGGQYYIESLSSANATSVVDKDGKRTSVQQGRHPLRSGDQVLLDSSDIRLLFLQRGVK